MKNKITRREFGATTLATVLASAMPAPFVWAAEKKYDPGASDTEIKLGQTVPHSGPGSLYGVLGRVGEAYFQMLNEKGGINGRKVKFFRIISQRAETSRRRGGWSSGEVLALYGSLGTAPQRPCTNISTQRRAAIAAQYRRRNERSEELNDHGGCRYIRPKRILAKHVVGASRTPRSASSTRTTISAAIFAPFKEGAGGCRRYRQGDHGQSYDLTEPTVDRS